MTRTIPTILTFALLLPMAASAETGPEIIDRIMEADTANYVGINNIFQRSRTLGHVTPEYFERQGGLMRLVPLPELLERQQSSEMSQATPAQLEDAARVLREESGKADAALQHEIAKEGLGGHGGMAMIIGMASRPEEKWLTSTPGGMMNLYADFLDAAAESKTELAKEKAKEPGEAAANLQLINEIKSQTRIIGRGTSDGVDVIELGADDLNVVQQTDDGTFTMNKVRIFVDEERYLPVRFKIDGILEQGSDSRAISIERIDSQFTNPEGCENLYKPQKSVMKMGGILTDKELAEITEAEGQLQELEQQLASMPKAQQDMMMKMMGPQIKMIRSMAAGGGIEVESDIVELRCNSAPPTAEELSQKFY